MNNRNLVVLAIIIISVIVAYGIYQWSSSGESGEEGVENIAPNLNESTTISTTSPSQNGSSSSREIANETNQSSISIPLEKPPFID